MVTKDFHSFLLYGPSYHFSWLLQPLSIYTYMKSIYTCNSYGVFLTKLTAITTFCKFKLTASYSSNSYYGYLLSLGSGSLFAVVGVGLRVHGCTCLRDVFHL